MEFQYIFNFHDWMSTVFLKIICFKGFNYNPVVCNDILQSTEKILQIEIKFSISQTKKNKLKKHLF